MRFGLKHYDLHHAIFGGSFASGNNAAPSTDLYLRRGNDADDYDTSREDDNDETTMETGPHSGDKRASPFPGKRK